MPLNLSSRTLQKDVLLPSRKNDALNAFFLQPLEGKVVSSAPVNWRLVPRFNGNCRLLYVKTVSPDWGMSTLFRYECSALQQQQQQT